MRVYICDDEKLILKELEKEIKCHVPEAEILCFASGSKLLGQIEALACDILFLDIDMPEISGMDIAKFAGYPISIFAKPIQICMIYVVPFAFVNYFPAQYLLRKTDMQQYPQIYLYLTPVIGGLLFFVVYLFWRYSLRHYKSSGN